MLELKVINLWGEPGCGKSTLAAGLFNLMKSQGHRVELVTEVAKDFTYGKNFVGLQNQLLLLGLQDERLRRLEGQVEWVITDSPLPMGIAYMGEEYLEWCDLAALAAYDRYENYDVLVHRGPWAYQEFGRNQDAEEATALSRTIRRIFLHATEGDEDFRTEVNNGQGAPYVLLDWVLEGEPLAEAA